MSLSCVKKFYSTLEFAFICNWPIATNQRLGMAKREMRIFLVIMIKRINKKKEILLHIHFYIAIRVICIIFQCPPTERDICTNFLSTFAEPSLTSDNLLWKFQRYTDYLRYDSNRVDGRDCADLEGSLHKNIDTYALRMKKRKSIILYYIYMWKYIILRYITSHVRKHPPRRVYIIYIYMFIHLMHTYTRTRIRIYVHAPRVYTCTHWRIIIEMMQVARSHIIVAYGERISVLRLCTSRMYLYVYHWCLVARGKINAHSNNAIIIIIFICFYLIVVSPLCNSLWYTLQ